MLPTPQPHHRPSTLAAIALAVCTCAPLTMPSAAQQTATDDFTARMTKEHASDDGTLSMAGDMTPAQPVVTSRVEYGDGFRGVVARPTEAGADTLLPGVIVIHEWWGLNEHIVDWAARLAGEGYVALAVDLYDGEVATDREGAMKLMGGAMKNTERAISHLSAATEELRRQGATNLGVVGWCFGGAWSLQSAINLAEAIDAAVIYYGRLTADHEQLSKIDAPILGLFGSEDGGIPVDSVRAFEAALDELGKTAEIHIYEGANHAFANPTGNRFEPVAAADAWAKTKEWFAEYLK